MLRVLPTSRPEVIGYADVLIENVHKRLDV